MWAALLLGLTGSLGHCVGMCSGVALLVGRHPAGQGGRLLLAHLGRITTYSLLGAIAGGAGYLVTGVGAQAHHNHSSLATPSGLQGGMAVLAAVTAFYMVLALTGRAPTPESLLTGPLRWWRRAMHRLTQSQPATKTYHSVRRSLFSLYLMGLLWGLLPCGLVLTALITAATAGSPGRGALAMLLFGLGTWPVPLAVSLASRLKPLSGRWQTAIPSLRWAAALVVLVFGLQMGLRGLAAWGWLPHLHVGSVMLW